MNKLGLFALFSFIFIFIILSSIALAAGDFSLSVNPNNGLVTKGDSKTTTVTATRISGIGEFVIFSASGQPSGATISFNPPTCSPTCSVTMTISTTSNTPDGSYPITITAIGGGVTHTTTYTLTVTGCSSTIGFTLNPSTVVASGSVIPSALYLSGCDGKTVSFRTGLGCTGNQVSSCIVSGGSCSGPAFTAPSLAGSYSYTACIDKNGDGDYTGSEYYWTTLTVTSPPLPSISLSRSPTSVPADGSSYSTITAKTSNGASGAGITITFSTTLGTFISNTCLTDCNGECIKTIKSPTAGTATVTATASGYTQGQTTVTFTSITWSITLTASPNPLPAGSSTTLSARANYDVGPFDYDIKFYEGNTVIKTCGTTGKTCSYSITKPAGTHYYTAKVVAQDGSAKATSGTVSVEWTPCTPNCNGKSCGDDGCGGSCGTCPSGYTCSSGSCVPSGSISLSPSPASVPPDGVSTSTITATISPAASGKVINFATTLGTLSATSCTTGSSGSCSVTIKSSAVGTATVAGSCSGYTSGQTTVTFSQPGVFDFSLSANPTSGAIVQGNSITTTVTASLISGSGSVSFSASPAISGVSYIFSPTSCNPTCSSTMTITTISATPAGNYAITITGTGGGKTHSATYTLTVSQQPTQCTRANPTVSITPSSQSGLAGSNLTYTVTVANGDSGTSCTRQVFALIPICSSGWVCSFPLPSLSIAPGATNTTIINVTSPSAASGSNVFSVIADSDGYLSAASATYVVSPVPCTRANPTVSITPSSQSGLAGSNLTYTVTVANGDSGTSCTRQVFALIPACSGWVCSFPLPSLSIAPGATNTTIINVTSPSAASGSNSFTVAAISGSYTGTGSATYVVSTACSRDNPDVIVNPSEISKEAGENHTFTITVTNNDSSTCDKSTFNLTTNCLQGWQCTLNPNSLSISPGSSNSSNLTIKSASTAALGQYLINLTVVNRADTKYNATKSIGFIVISKCGGASIKITDAYVYNNSAKITVENNGTAGNLTITSANITDKSGKIYKADNLPITNFDVKETEYINFNTAPNCTNVSKVTVATNCPKASDTSTAVRCLTIPPNATVIIVNVTHKSMTVNATLRNIGTEAIDSGLIRILLNGVVVKCKQTFTLAPKSSRECDIPNFDCSGTAKLEITEPNENEIEFECEKVITITVQSCKDADCNQPLETFTKGEEVYFNVETDPADASVTAVIHNGGTETIDLTEPFKPEETGSYTIELTASKEGYSESTKELSFVVEAKSGVSPKIIIVILIILGLAGFMYYRLKRTGKTGTYEKLYAKYGKKETYEDLYRKYGRNRRYHRRRR